MFKYLFIEVLMGFFGGLIVLYLIIHILKREHVIRYLKTKKFIVPVVLLCIMLLIGMFANKTYPPHFAMPPWMQSHAPDGITAALPVDKVFKFLKTKSRVEHVENISADPNDVPAPIDRDEPTVVEFSLVAQEVIGEIAPGIHFNYWTYDQQVPGPMFRVRVGDTVRTTLTNHPTSLHPHNIDLHAVTGPGGGATLSKVQPGETKTFEWKALNPGLYVYHCATANIATHNAHGQYGMILVEPEEGLPPVDKEFYIMQGELYTAGNMGKKGLVPFDSKSLIDGIPNYVNFNGIVEQEPRMQVNTGDRVRIYVGNGGLNVISSFHVIGEIFDEVYPEAAIGSDTHKNVQTTAVLPGGASIVEFTAEVPGNLTLVDHALARMNKGAWAVMEVIGEDRPDIYTSVKNLE